MAIEKILTPEFRVGFPNVFKARSVNGSEPKFSVTMLFPPGTNLDALKAAAAKAARDKWGDKVPPGLKSPFKNSGEKAHLDGFEEGAIHINATSKYQPGLVDRSVQPIIDETEFYGGCYARATVNAYAYEHPQGGKGVSFGLLNLQKIRDGEPFSARGNAEDDFDALPNAEGQAGAAAPAASDADSLFS